uniref:polynucleotide adenylyltransferase n=1 Tax=Globodera rostochiensis TaxID=31243 RepID=A0A914I046_GLORO
MTSQSYLNHFALLAFVVFNFPLEAFCCIGFSAFSSLSASPVHYPSFCCGRHLDATNLVAKGVPNVPFSWSKNIDMRAKKCQSSEIASYRTNEVRRLVTLYQFNENQGAQMSCAFDPSESCAWHNAEQIQFGRQLFMRARFESPKFSAERFDCTGGERAFPLEGFFLLVGGRDESVLESSAAIEAKVPCQIEKAMLKLDYWSINETPILKICVVPDYEENLVPLCEESKIDINPLTFEIPQNERPFRLRIQVDNIVGRDDIVLIDNIRYEGNICLNAPKPPTKSITELLMSKTPIGGEEELEAVEGKLNDEEAQESGAEGRKMEQDGTMGGKVPTGEEFELFGPISRGDDGFYPEEAMRQKSFKNKKDFGRRFRSFHRAKDEAFGPDGTSLCAALKCNFDAGKACRYSRKGIDAMSSWKVGEGPTGNPHTGIHKSCTDNAKLVGYAFVGSDLEESEDELFVLESPKLRVNESILLVFDLFQRSVGPQLRVCLNTLRNCSFENPRKPHKAKHWLVGQKVILPRGTEKVFFVGSKLQYGGTSSTNVDDTPEKEDGTQLLANFMDFFKASAGNNAAARKIALNLRVNSILWFLRRKVIDLLNFANVLFANDDILVFLLNHAQHIESLTEYLSEEIPSDIFQIDDVFLNCNINEQIERIYNKLQDKIGDINGQNIVNLLDIYDNFRHFFCLQMDMRRTKAALYTLTSNKYVIRIEDQFPEIFKIDIMFNPVLLERVRQLLMSRSCSTRFRSAFMRLTMALLISRLVEFESRISGIVRLCEQMRRELKEKVNLAVTAAYRNLLSEENLCVLIKLNEFVQSIGPKKSRKINEQMERRFWVTDECGSEMERAKIMEKFRKDGLGELYKEAVERTVAYQRKDFITLLRTPGTKTRLAQLIGSDQKLDELLRNPELGTVFQEITMLRTDLLWKHYEIVLLNNNSLCSLNAKLAADVTVFFFWLRTAFIKVLNFNGTEKMGQNLTIFFGANALDEIITEFSIGKFKAAPIKISAENREKSAESEATDGEIHHKSNESYADNSHEQNAKGLNANANEYEGDENIVPQHVQCPPSDASLAQLRALDNERANNEAFVHGTLQTFLAYLKRDETNLGPSEKHKNLMEMKVYGVLFYLHAFFNNLMEFAVKCVADQPFGSLFDLELKKVKKQREELLDRSETKWAEVFLLSEFIKFFLNNKILWENSAHWQGRLLDELMNSLGSKKTENWVKPKYDDISTKTYFTNLNDSGKSDSMHFYSITELIRQYLEVQRFFCDLSDSTIIQNVKRKIAVIIGEDYLIELDEMFPEILQIDALIPLTQTPLYKRFLDSKSGTEQQLLIECRIALPLLLYRLKWFIVKAPTVKGKILDAFREKLGQIRRIAYRGLRRELTGIGRSNLTRECLLRSICIVHRFAGFTSATFALSGSAKEAVKEEDISSWSPEGKCDGEKALRAAYQELHFLLAKTHCRHLTVFLRTNMLNLRGFVREKRGAKNRIRKLVNGHDEFMHEFRVELKDPNLFTNSRLMDDYLDAFFDQDKTTRVVGNLSVFITVWVRWMEHQFLTDDWSSRTTLEAKRVNELMWTKVKLFFEDLYDEFVDVADFDELEQKSNLLRELQRRVWEFAETKHHQLKRTEPKVPQIMALNLGQQRRKFRLDWNNLWEHWHKIVEEAARHKARGVRLMEENREYEQWIDGLHWDMLLTLVGEDETFRKNLKKGFMDDEKAKARLKDFINWEMVETLMQLLLKEETTHFDKELEVIRQREGWGEREIGETEEELKRKSKEENALADQRMQEMIREEEHFKDVKKKMEQRQLEKRKRQRERERLKEQTRGERARSKEEEESEGDKKKMLERETERKEESEGKKGKMLERETERKEESEGEKEKMLEREKEESEGEKEKMLARETERKEESEGEKEKMLERETERKEESEGEKEKMLERETERKEESEGEKGKMLERETERKEESEGEKKKINKLLKAIAGQKSAAAAAAAESWHKLNEMRRHDVLCSLFSKKANLASRFNALLGDWTAMVGQQSIDRNLYDQFAKNNFGGFEVSHLALNFVENTQQIYLNCYDERRHEKLLYEFFKENGFNDCQKELLESELLEEVKSIVSKWSDGSARLVVTGSFQLGALTPNSDIDIICIVPQRLALKEEKDKFYGALSNCDLSRPSAVGRFCEDGSLYCHFCKSEKVQSLLKIPFAQTPLLQLKFAGRDFDITFVAIPDIERLPDDPLEGADVEALSEMLASRGRAPEAMLRSFSSYLDNIRIIEVLKEKNLTKFRQLLFMLKLWAKSNQIYGNMFGFVNGICLAIISAKIILWYPKSSVPFLFEKLLFVLIIWNWQVPITLTNQTEGNFIWTQQSGLAPVMPIITPGNLAQNGAANVNASTFKIMQKQIKQTLSQLKEMNNNEEKFLEWRKLFSVQKFTEKYTNFMVISCVVSAQQHIEQFCGFVERRIRPFLLRFDQIMANFVEYSHIMPDKNLAKGNECPPKVISPQFVRTPYCKIWLVGLNLKEHKIVEEYYGIGKKEFRKYLNEQFNNEFDAKIYNEYDVKVLRGWYQNIKLSSTFVPDPSQLTEWKLIN